MVAVAILEQSLLNRVFVESASVRQTFESTSANIRNMTGTDTDRYCLNPLLPIFFADYFLSSISLVTSIASHCINFCFANYVFPACQNIPSTFFKQNITCNFCGQIDIIRSVNSLVSNWLLTPNIIQILSNFPLTIVTLMS